MCNEVMQRVLYGGEEFLLNFVQHSNYHPENVYVVSQYIVTQIYLCVRLFLRASLDNCWMLQPSVRNYVFATTDFYNFQL